MRIYLKTDETREVRWAIEDRLIAVKKRVAALKELKNTFELIQAEGSVVILESALLKLQDK